jgi:hypothetical protein
MAQHVFQLGDAAAAAADEIPGLQKGGWLGPITDFLEIILEVRARERRDEARRARRDPAAKRRRPRVEETTKKGGETRRAATTPRLEP